MCSEPCLNQCLDHLLLSGPFLELQALPGLPMCSATQSTLMLLRHPVRQSTPMSCLAGVYAGAFNLCSVLLLSLSRWVPDVGRRNAYTGHSCRSIRSHENCQFHGRNDTSYLDWRWEPSQPGCTLKR